MSTTLSSKTFYSIGKRHDGEVYGPALDTRPDSRRASAM